MTTSDDKLTSAAIREAAALAKAGADRIACPICGKVGVATSPGAFVMYSENGLEYVHGACLKFPPLKFPPSIRQESEAE